VSQGRVPLSQTESAKDSGHYLMSDGREGPPLELRGLFEQFLHEAG